MIKKIKRYGFKTIRFPVTWMFFIDDHGNIKSDWMILVKEVVDLIVNTGLYCILNMQNEGVYGGWLSIGMDVLDIYINLWKQIANEFKDYNEYLIFESMNDIYFYNYITYSFDFNILLTFNQAFIDTIRNSGEFNIQRLLIVAGANNDLDLTCSSDYKIPIDPSNKLAVSIHYYNPQRFTKEVYFEPYSWTDYDGVVYYYEPTLSWGDSEEYFQIITEFEMMKNTFVNKGIPIIINEVGVFTEEKKEIESIREYLYMVFSISSDINGIMSCLWDTSNIIFGDMNFYDRENDKWYDDKLKENFLQISRGKYIKPTDFYIQTHFETVTMTYIQGGIEIKIGVRKALKIIVNARITGTLFIDAKFNIFSYDSLGNSFQIQFGKSNVKKQYDGTHVITVDVSKINCYDYILVSMDKSLNHITLNNLTVEFEESFKSIDNKSFKASIKKYIY
jgi:endoglucanase